MKCRYKYINQKLLILKNQLFHCDGISAQIGQAGIGHPLHPFKAKDRNCTKQAFLADGAKANNDDLNSDNENNDNDDDKNEELLMERDQGSGGWFW